MSLPPILRNSLNPPELELIACQELVDIMPLISLPRIAFISGAYGPLQPPRQAKIPLWMAVNLKQRKKCHILAPEWLSTAFLQEKLDIELSETGFSELPPHYAEISKVLLDVASDDLLTKDKDPDKIRSLLKDLREARQAKCRKKLERMDPNAMQLSNLSAMEINEIRPFFVQSLWVLNQLTHRPTEEEDPDATFS